MSIMSQGVFRHSLMPGHSEETQEELYSRMSLFQEGEKQQMVDLTDFLDAELDFVAKYYEILRDLKTEWNNGWVLTYSPLSRIS